ncbi:hypothetical protein ACJ41O_008561 [Fusarium nematophilum]
MSPSPNGGGGSGPPAPTRESYRHSMEEWRQQALAQRNQYQPRVQDQINRQFHEYSPPFYASVIGHGRDKNLLVTTSRLSGFAATLGRDLEDEETRAIAEHTLNNIHTNAALKWLTLGLAAYMTYRGRRTWQFPFYKPKMDGRFNPDEATSLFSSKKIRGRYPRFVWHTMRFTAYAAVTMLGVEPIFRGVNFIRTETAMTQDPRLKQFTADASKRVEQVMANPMAMRVPAKAREETQEEDGSDPSGGDSQDAEPSWRNYRRELPPWNRSPTAASSAQNQQSDQDWDLLDDDEDDASPVAASSRSQPVGSTPGGSAWDRIRQQSQGGRQQQQQSGSESRGGWEAQSQGGSQTQSQSDWGNGSASSSGDGYTFSRTDEERSLAKEQAQQEFDQLVEQERKGAEQGRSWGR